MKIYRLEPGSNPQPCVQKAGLDDLMTGRLEQRYCVKLFVKGLGIFSVKQFYELKKIGGHPLDEDDLKEYMTVYDNKDVDTGKVKGRVQLLTADLIHKGLKYATSSKNIIDADFVDEKKIDGASEEYHEKHSQLFGLAFQCDEAHFWLNGYVNKQNCRIWSEANPQVYVETPLHPEKLTVWCALWAGGILLQKR
ncbi:hypothetical protein TNCV_4443481 [Trichonephila clavipes]|nr:hypothetical protein TNCV_4443481 [Trichonephila clavipes]